jgi:hypothetical protein
MITGAFAAGHEIAQQLLAAKEEWSSRLLLPPPGKALRGFSLAGVLGTAVNIVQNEHDNIVGVGIGEKRMAGFPIGVPALKIYVRHKILLGELSQLGINLLPKSTPELPVDVEEIGTVTALQVAAPDPRQVFRPAQPGCSIGFALAAGRPPMAGTLGALVAKDRDLFLLSNNHVLANESRLPIGTPIFQPGLLDATGGRPSAIAKLTRPIDLRLGFMNKVDAAIARLDAPGSAVRDILFIGAPRGVAKAAHDMVVHKFGRTTGYRAGRISSINTDVKVRYETGEYLLEGQIIIEGLNGQSFSETGDSGSLVVERTTGAAIGLLCGGSRSHSIANHLNNVLDMLHATLA